MLCAYAFPNCHMEGGRAVKAPLCFEDCQATHLQFCYNGRRRAVCAEINKYSADLLRAYFLKSILKFG